MEECYLNRVEKLRWLSQRRGMETMVADRARTDEGDESADAVEISYNSV